MKISTLPKIVAGLILASSHPLIGATVAVDWLVFRADDSGPDRVRIGSDDMGNDLVEIRIEKIAGALVPGSPSTGSLAGGSWTSEIPLRDSQAGWDNGINRHTLPLHWSPDDQSLSDGGLDPQAQNSEFAIFELGAEAVGQVRFEIPQGYERGSGDVLEFAIGITIPEPHGILMIATVWIFAMAR